MSPCAQVVHLAGAHEHRVAGLDVDAGRRRGRVEIVAGDRVVLVEVVDAVQPRDVEQHAAGRDRADVLDAELRRAVRRHDRVGVSFQSLPS